MKFDWTKIWATLWPIIVKSILAALGGGTVAYAMTNHGYTADAQTTVGLTGETVTGIAAMLAAIASTFLSPLLTDIKGKVGLGLTPEEHGWLEDLHKALPKNQTPPAP